MLRFGVFIILFFYEVYIVFILSDLLLEKYFFF